MAALKTARQQKQEAPAIDQIIAGDAAALSAQLQALREKLFPPEAKNSCADFRVETLLRSSA